VKRYNRKDRRYVMHWELLSVRTSTPSLCEFTGSKTTDPTAKAPVIAANGKKKVKKPRVSARLKLLPKPCPSLSQPQLQKNLGNKTYNVVCSVAVSNIRKSLSNGEWCDLMYFQNQHISMIACLVISADHPYGITKFFCPDQKILASIKATSHCTASIRAPVVSAAASLSS